MFIVAITKRKLIDNFNGFRIERKKLNLFETLIVTDNVLSKYIENKRGFSVIESPMLSSGKHGDVILSELKVVKEHNSIEVYKPVISGRPIYYHISTHGGFYCSTHISLLRKAGVPICENERALPEFFVYRLVIPPRTLYKNIEQLMLGSRLIFEVKRDKWQLKSFSRIDPPEAENRRDSIETIAGKSRQLLIKSINNISLCKENSTVLLSGGLDSSVLCQIHKRTFNIDTTYSTGFPFEHSSKNTEKEYAISAANALKTKHVYYEYTNRDYLDAFIRGIAAAEEPLHHMQSVLLFLVFNSLPKQKSIIISGEGADGLFGGSKQRHISFTNSHIFNLAMFSPFRQLLQVLTHLSNRWDNIWHYLIEIDNNLNKFHLEDPNHLIWNIGSYGSSDWVCDFYNVSRSNIIENRYAAIKPFKDRSLYDVISFISIFGSGATTQSIWSKMGEDRKKILYYPYYDSHLMNYIFSIDWDVKLKKPKRILRKIAEMENIPQFIINRPKSSFGLKNNNWSTKDGIFEPISSMCSKVFDEIELRKMQSTDPVKAMNFWNILNYSIWKRLFINNEPVDLLIREMEDGLLKKRRRGYI